MKTTVAALALLLFSVAASEAVAAESSPNPYGVAGWGRLNLLGMPADCLDYDWNGLHPGTLCQMCRPNHYYNYIGIPPRWWGYDEITWFAHQGKEYRAKWLRYARDWVRRTDADAHLQMPGSRTLASPVDGKRWYHANDPSPAVPGGFGDEGAIRSIWQEGTKEK